MINIALLSPRQNYWQKILHGVKEKWRIVDKSLC